MNEIVIFYGGGVYDFEDDPEYFGGESKIFQERRVQVTDNDLNWLQRTREEDGWADFFLQGVLKEMFERE